MGETEKKPKADILIVDDNPINLNLLSSLLTEQNYKVRAANSGLRAIASANAKPPDLIMLDINMPEIDGYEVCKLLKENEKTRNIPVIFISALDETIDKVRAFKVGGVDYVTKPFQIEEVLARLENQLKISALQQELERKNRELVVTNQELAKKNEELSRSREELLESYKKADQVFAAMSELLPGMVLDGKYRLEKKIGAGGFGVVYQATQLALNRSVAVKIFHPMTGNITPESLERFRREGVSASRIKHPNAVAVLDYSISSDSNSNNRTRVAYLVMELLNGTSLSQVLKETGCFSPIRAAEVIVPVCEVLAVAHRAGIVHRDIKPDNIFLHQSEDGEVVKVVDFGIAKLLQHSFPELQNLTFTGKVLGTPAFMAPERLNNSSYDGRADVYSLGVTLYKMLTGKMPFEVDKNDLMSIIIKQLTEKPKPLRDINPELPIEIEKVVLQALEKDPNRRPTAKELAQLLYNAVKDLSQISLKPSVMLEELDSDEDTTVDTESV
ncbi:MAG: protein kinase [Blastocatellia bacterium]|nr:protein kinase [Blastocatellia bacterium]